MDDFLFLGVLLEDRIKEKIPDTPVRQLADLSDIGQLALRGAMVCVAYAGEEIAPIDAAYPCEARVTQRWLTIVSVQTAARVADGGRPRSKAGPLRSQVADALQGQVLRGDCQPLRRTTPPGPVMEDGFAHFPLCWETTFTVTGHGGNFYDNFYG